MALLLRTMIVGWRNEGCIFSCFVCSYKQALRKLYYVLSVHAVGKEPISKWKNLLRPSCQDVEVNLVLLLVSTWRQP